MSINDEWILKMWYIPHDGMLFGYYMKEVLTYITTQMNLENIILSDRSQS